MRYSLRTSLAILAVSVATLAPWTFAMADGGQAYSPPGFVIAVPPEPAVKPIISHPRDLDSDLSGIDDKLEARLREIRSALAIERGPKKRGELNARLSESVSVELVFSRQIAQQQIDDFMALGGQIEYVYQAASYGWNGTIPLHAVEKLPERMGDSLVAVVEPSPVELHLDEATRTGRARAAWQAGFSGDPNMTIAIIDTGVDESHDDLKGRQAYWEDFTSDNEGSPRDVVQHGTHVTAIATGTGMAAANMGEAPGNIWSLRYTDGGDMASLASGTWLSSPIHVPLLPGDPNAGLSSTARWKGGDQTELYGMSAPDGVAGNYVQLSAPQSGLSPLGEGNNFAADPTRHYSARLNQNPAKSVQRYLVANYVSYRSVGDAFRTFRGVAPACRWAGAKAYRNDGTGSSTDISEAIDDLIFCRGALNIRVVNISMTATGMNVTLRNKVNTMVNSGMVVIVAAGNNTAEITDPGRAGLAITVAASNDVNELTDYSNFGFANPGASEDAKPDLTAPGGSRFYSRILAADSNDADGDRAPGPGAQEGFADEQSNDYYNISGTSMAAPFVSGAAALVIQAMKSEGMVWDWQSSMYPLLVKMLLCATATESNANREGGAGSDPTLGRAANPKDLYEGYGLINPDAAIKAVCQQFEGGIMTGGTVGGRFDRRAWAAYMILWKGTKLKLSLDVPAGADYDMYVYNGSPGPNGNPTIIASSTQAGNGVNELIDTVSSGDYTGYLVIKRVSGFGPWTLTASAISLPQVTDSGAAVKKRRSLRANGEDSLYASWDASDPIWGIAEYQYAIGTAPNNLIVEWKSAGADTEATEENLSLDVGQMYYWYVMALNGLGQSSEIGVSDGILAVEEENADLSIPQAKSLPDSLSVGLNPRTVTAVFGDHFHIEESDRVAGIRVEPIEMPLLWVNATVEVAGTMETVEGERCIGTATATVTGADTIEPLMLINRNIGGGDWEYNAGTGAGQKGVKGGSGVNNIGLLITTVGRVTHADTDYFYLDDGSALDDGSGHIGVKVLATGLSIPAQDAYVQVTGISSCFKVGDDLYRLIRVRDQADIVVIQ